MNGCKENAAKKDCNVLKGKGRECKRQEYKN